jgi:Fur family ferric uptake transcriptional regulator
MKMKVKIKKNARPARRTRSDLDGLRSFRQCQLQRGLKHSSKREAIAAYFLKADRHFTVEQLYTEMKHTYPHIGYSTVYRTLKLLTDCGIATVHHFDEDEARFEPTHRKQHHDHLVCERCGRIIEFTHEHIEQFQKEVERKHGFAVRSRELQLYGICNKCRKKSKGR